MREVGVALNKAHLSQARAARAARCEKSPSRPEMYAESTARDESSVALVLEEMRPRGATSCGIAPIATSSVDRQDRLCRFCQADIKEPSHALFVCVAHQEQKHTAYNRSESG